MSNSPSSSIPLENLHDIHLPAPIGWWPPAPGWWILSALIIIGTIALGFWLMRRARQRRYHKFALIQLHALHQIWQEQHDDIAFAQATNRLLKQTALAAFPATNVAALNGADWLDWLDRKLRKPEPIAAEALCSAAQYWIQSHRC